MKKIATLTVLLTSLLFFQSCTKTESDFTTPPPDEPETITIVANASSITTGGTVNFTVNSSVNNNVTAQSKVYVNGTLITGNSYTFLQEGNFAVYASYGSINSAVITIQVTTPAVVTRGFASNVLVEEYSGTWCGNCPRLLYGVELLQQQTTRAVVVGIHLFNGDPFISSDGNNLASSQGVSGVPTGNINRTVSWAGPQYLNVNQVTDQIDSIATMGLAISSAVTGNSIDISIKAGYTQAAGSTTKLTVYIVEDDLFFTQANYSSNIYGGQSSISNFMYDGVLRDVVSSVQGDDIAASGTSNEKTYSVNVPSNIADITKASIVAFVTDAAGNVLNVQQAKLGETKDFERM
jgi:hypothetical protein